MRGGRDIDELVDSAPISNLEQGQRREPRAELQLFSGQQIHDGSKPSAWARGFTPARLTHIRPTLSSAGTEVARDALRPPPEQVEPVQCLGECGGEELGQAPVGSWILWLKSSASSLHLGRPERRPNGGARGQLPASTATAPSAHSRHSGSSTGSDTYRHGRFVVGCGESASHPLHLLP